MNHERAYFLLDVHAGSTPEQIKKMYYKKALKCHPDKNGNKDEFQELNEAYEFLSNQRDPILPILFHSSIHFVLSKLDKAVLISLYNLLLDYKDSIPESVFDTIRNHIPPVLIIEPTLADLLNQHVYIYTHNSKKYSIPMWHHELIYDEFTVLCKPDLDLEIDDENNIHVDVHTTIQDAFANGIFIDSISLQVDISKLIMVPYQMYCVPSTIPRIQERDVYSATECALFIVHVYFS
jgi:hypothetical protein